MIPKAIWKRRDLIRSPSVHRWRSIWRADHRRFTPKCSKPLLEFFRTYLFIWMIDGGCRYDAKSTHARSLSIEFLHHWLLHTDSSSQRTLDKKNTSQRTIFSLALHSQTAYRWVTPQQQHIETIMSPEHITCLKDLSACSFNFGDQSNRSFGLILFSFVSTNERNHWMKYPSLSCHCDTCRSKLLWFFHSWLPVLPTGYLESAIRNVDQIKLDIPDFDNSNALESSPKRKQYTKYSSSLTLTYKSY